MLNFSVCAKIKLLKALKQDVLLFVPALWQQSYPENEAEVGKQLHYREEQFNCVRVPLPRI